MAAQVVQRTLTSIAANVRRIRMRRGLTQEKLAELADVEPRTIQHVETGTANPTIRLIVEIAAALGVTTTALLRAARLRPRPAGRPRSRGGSANT